jgi:hypothetical protein
MFSAIGLQVFRLEHGEELMLAELEERVAFALRGFEIGGAFGGRMTRVGVLSKLGFRESLAEWKSLMGLV